jgi:hypothetical protein
MWIPVGMQINFFGAIFIGFQMFVCVWESSKPNLSHHLSEWLHFIAQCQYVRKCEPTLKCIAEVTSVIEVQLSRHVIGAPYIARFNCMELADGISNYTN